MMEQDRTGEVVALTQVLMQRGRLSPPELGDRLIHPLTIQALVRSLCERMQSMSASNPADRELMQQAMSMIRMATEYAVQAMRLSASVIAKDDEERALQSELVCMSWLYDTAMLENAVSFCLHQAEVLDDLKAQCDRLSAELQPKLIK